MSPQAFDQLQKTAEQHDSLKAAGNYLCIYSFFLFYLFISYIRLLRYISQLKVFPANFSP